MSRRAAEKGIAPKAGLPVLCAACLVLSLLAVARPAKARQSDQREMNAITSALRAREYEKADALARAALKETPHEPRLLTLDGIALAALHKDKEALQSYQAALKASPDFIAALEGAAQIEYQKGSARAQPLLEHVLKLRPNDSTSHAMLGVIAFKKHDCKSAIMHFRASADLISSQPSAMEQFGVCLVREDQAKDAVPIFQQLLASAPDDFRSRFQLAEAQFLAGDSKDSVATLEPLLDAPQPRPAALDLAASAYEEMGNTPRAVVLLRQAIIASPKDADYYLDFATLSYNHSSFQVGIDMLNAGLARIPKSARLYLARGVLYVQLAQYDKAEADFETADRLDPKQAFGSDAQGLAQFEQSDLDRALATARSQLRAHPNDAFLYYLVADTLLQKGAAPGSAEFKEALGAAARAVQLNPGLIVARDALASLYLKTGQTAKAAEESRAALRADPTDQSAIYHLIQALRSSDRQHEIPGLLKRLAALRADAQKMESATNRYRLIEPGAPATQPQAPPKP